MTNPSLLRHGEYIGSVEVSLEDGCLHGRILFIRDLVTYEAQNVSDLKRAFEEAVDDYLETCRELGKEPQKPFSGTFNVRIGPERHKHLATYAVSHGININDAVKKAVDQLVSENNDQTVHHFHHMIQVEFAGAAAEREIWQIPQFTKQPETQH